MKKLYKCPRCKNYSIEKVPSTFLSLIPVNIFGFLGACILGGFALIIYLILLLITIITLIVSIVKLIINKRVIHKYKCNSCGSEFFEEHIDFTA